MYKLYKNRVKPYLNISIYKMLGSHLIIVLVYNHRFLLKRRCFKQSSLLSVHVSINISLYLYSIYLICSTFHGALVKTQHNVGYQASTGLHIVHDCWRGGYSVGIGCTAALSCDIRVTYWLLGLHAQHFPH